MTTKLHVVVNAIGLPLRFVLTPGQASDKTTAPLLLSGLRLAPDIVADRGYSAKTVIDWCAERGATAHIPSQRNVRVPRSVTPDLYRKRNVVQRYQSAGAAGGKPFEEQLKAWKQRLGL